MLPEMRLLCTAASQCRPNSSIKRLGQHFLLQRLFQHPFSTRVSLCKPLECVVGSDYDLYCPPFGNVSGEICKTKYFAERRGNVQGSSREVDARYGDLNKGTLFVLLEMSCH